MGIQKRVKEHLREDIKEAKKGIKRDKMLLSKVSCSNKKKAKKKSKKKGFSTLNHVFHIDV